MADAEQLQRVIVYLLWAFGCVFFWGRVLLDEWQRYRSLPVKDRRQNGNHRSDLVVIRRAAFRDFLSVLALFMVAVAASLSLVILLMAPEFSGVRGFFLALALGGFLGAGILRWP